LSGLQGEDGETDGSEETAEGHGELVARVGLGRGAGGVGLGARSIGRSAGSILARAGTGTGTGTRSVAGTGAAGGFSAGGIVGNTTSVGRIEEVLVLAGGKAGGVVAVVAGGHGLERDTRVGVASIELSGHGHVRDRDGNAVSLAGLVTGLASSKALGEGTVSGGGGSRSLGDGGAGLGRDDGGEEEGGDSVLHFVGC